MAKRKSTYSSRRSRRSSFSKLFEVHPIVAVLVVIVMIFVIWRSQASTADNRLQPDIVVTDSLFVVNLPPDVAQQMVEYPGFIVSFNADYHMPNYVAWELTADEASAPGSRNSKFMSDPDVKGCPDPADYRNSGFDKGHMIPAADTKWSPEAMAASHYLTNICPQDHKLNAGAWVTLESNCRNWARRDSAIIVICGPVLSDRMPRTIGREGQIPVPERFWKVVLSPYTNPPRGIAFVMPNGPVDGGVQAVATSIDRVEAITGYDFFAALPDSIENSVEASSSYHIWQRQSP